MPSQRPVKDRSVIPRLAPRPTATLGISSAPGRSRSPVGELGYQSSRTGARARRTRIRAIMPVPRSPRDLQVYEVPFTPG